MQDDLDVSFVIPIYNNASILPATIEKLQSYFSRTRLRYDLIFVNDASTDASLSIIETAAQTITNIKLLNLAMNGGQQRALMQGFMVAGGKVVIAVDADLPCEMTDLMRLAQMANEGVELVLGKRTGDIRRTWLRRLGSKIGNLLFRLLFEFQIQDFGCGIGAIRRQLIERLRSHGVPARLIKLDLLFLAESYVEVDVNTTNTISQNRSSYSFSKLLGLLWQLINYPKPR